MSTRFISPNWRMPKNANQSKSSNYSLDFDGSQFVQVSSTNFGSGSFSISTWFNQETMANNTYQVLFAGQGYSPGNSGLSFYLYRNGSNNEVRVWTMLNGSSLLMITGSVNYNFNEWNHACITREYNGSWILYLNGSPIGSSVARNTDNFQSTPSYIGKNNYGLNFNGKISTTSIFDYALSQGQITTLYGTGSAIGNPMALPSSPIAYYPLGTSAWNGEYLAENNAIGDYVFDFTPNDYIQTGGFTIGNNYSFSCWLKSDTTSPNNMCFLSSPNYYTIGYDGNFVIRFTTATQIQMFSYNERSDSESSTVTIPSIDTNWHHFALTSNGTTTNIYWDGSPLTVTGNQTKSLDNISQGLIIGDNITRNNNAFDGELSNVQIFNTALLGSEVETLYNYGSPIQTLANIPQSSNLKAWYKLDATEIYNSSSTEWEVNNVLSPWTSSLNLVPNDYIDCGNDSSLSISGDLTLSAWVYLDTTPNSFMSIFSKMSSTSRNYTLYARNNRQFSITTQDSGGVVEFTTSNTAIPLKTWTHIVVTFDSGVNNGTKYYFNGIQDAVTGTHNVVADTSNLNIGKRTTSTQYLDGKISNAQIFNTALSGPEVETLYNNGNPLTDMSSFSSLVSWWKLDNTITGIEDSKGSNNGTNNGATEALGSVSTLNGLSSGMSQSNLVQSDLQTVAPYSKYAMSFDGTDSVTVGSLFGQVQDVFSVSTWVNFSSNNGYQMILSDNIWLANYTANNIGLDIKNSSGGYYDNNGGISQGTNFVIPSDLRTNKWIHVAFSYEGSSSGTTAVIKMYLNSVEMVNTTVTYPSGNANLQNASNVYLGSRNGASQFLDGSISNVSIWNYALTTSEVREVYNEGLPSNLNTFSGTAPIAWWQLGENSSYVGGWTFADEIGSNNGDSGNLPETALTNGVGATANGVSSGMSEGNLVGDAPYSTANAISSGMTVTARGTDVPS